MWSVQSLQSIVERITCRFCELKIITMVFIGLERVNQSTSQPTKKRSNEWFSLRFLRFVERFKKLAPAARNFQTFFKNRNFPIFKNRNYFLKISEVREEVTVTRRSTAHALIMILFAMFRFFFCSIKYSKTARAWREYGEKSREVFYCNSGPGRRIQDSTGEVALRREHPRELLGPPTRGVPGRDAKIPSDEQALAGPSGCAATRPGRWRGGLGPAPRASLTSRLLRIRVLPRFP